MVTFNAKVCNIFWVYDTSDRSKTRDGWLSCSFLYQIHTTNMGMWCRCTYAHTDMSVLATRCRSASSGIEAPEYRTNSSSLAQQRGTISNGWLQRSFWIVYYCRKFAYWWVTWDETVSISTPCVSVFCKYVKVIITVWLANYDCSNSYTAL